MDRLFAAPLVPLLPRKTKTWGFARGGRSDGQTVALPITGYILNATVIIITEKNSSAFRFPLLRAAASICIHNPQSKTTTMPLLPGTITYFFFLFLVSAAVVVVVVAQEEGAQQQQQTQTLSVLPGGATLAFNCTTTAATATTPTSTADEAPSQAPPQQRRARCCSSSDWNAFHNYGRADIGGDDPDCQFSSTDGVFEGCAAEAVVGGGVGGECAVACDSECVLQEFGPVSLVDGGSAETTTPSSSPSDDGESASATTTSGCGRVGPESSSSALQLLLRLLLLSSSLSAARYATTA